jgi:DNA-binding response OmpR family regulator
MTRQNHLAGKRILIVDDEEDILATLADLLEGVATDPARDHDTALGKIRRNRYDLAILDIMGVDGLKLLEETVAAGIPTVMLTAHAVSAETLMESIRKGAIAYVPKETLADLAELLNDLLDAQLRGEPPWKLLFDRLGEFFDRRFGPGWKTRDAAFWQEFSRTHEVGKGIQARLMHDPRIRDKGV